MTDFGREQEEESRCFDNFSIPGFPRPTDIEKEKQNRQKSDSDSVCQWPGNWVVAKLVNTSVGTNIWLLTLILDYCDTDSCETGDNWYLAGSKIFGTSTTEKLNKADFGKKKTEHEWSEQSYTLYWGGGGRELPWVDGLRQPVSEGTADAGGHRGRREGGGKGNTYIIMSS